MAAYFWIPFFHDLSCTVDQTEGDGTFNRTHIDTHDFSMRSHGKFDHLRSAVALTRDWIPPRILQFIGNVDQALLSAPGDLVHYGASDGYFSVTSDSRNYDDTCGQEGISVRRLVAHKLWRPQDVHSKPRVTHTQNDQKMNSIEHILESGTLGVEYRLTDVAVESTTSETRFSWRWILISSKGASKRRKNMS